MIVNNDVKSASRTPSPSPSPSLSPSPSRSLPRCARCAHCAHCARCPLQTARRSTRREEKRRKAIKTKAAGVIQRAFRLFFYTEQKRHHILRAAKEEERIHAAISRIQIFWRRRSGPGVRQLRNGVCDSLYAPSMSGNPNFWPRDVDRIPAESPPRELGLLPSGHVLASDETQGETQAVQLEDHRTTEVALERHPGREGTKGPADYPDREKRASIMTVTSLTSSATMTIATDGSAAAAAPSWCPPVGMMTVRIRIGNEESNITTPIVVAEGGKSEGISGSDDGVLIGALVDRDLGYPRGNDGPLDTVRGVAQISAPVSCTEIVRPDVQHSDSETGIRSKRMDRIEAWTSPRSLKSNAFGTQAAGFILRTERSNQAAGPTANEETKGMKTGRRIHPPLPSSAGHDVVPSARREGQESDRDGHSAESGGRTYMEDNEVYLECPACEVKYLVESVDAKIPTSDEDQPRALVLYLCPRCAGTLQPGVDGQWKRRRRPSSAPATAGRKKGSGRERCPTRPPSEGSLGVDNDHDRGGAENVECTVLAANSQEELGAKLKYAVCARRIQHAYHNFRHRQYLRNWALSSLRRWLLKTMEARRRSRRHLRLCSAATRIQSAVRASLARRHCSLLRDARLVLWVERAAAAVAANHRCDRPSPVGENLWLDAIQLSPSLQGHVLTPTRVSSQCTSDRHGNVNRALSEALAPGMGNPPPGCPGALDVDWEDWGVKLRLQFPPRSGGETVFPSSGGGGMKGGRTKE